MVTVLTPTLDKFFTRTKTDCFHRHGLAGPSKAPTFLAPLWAHLCTGALDALASTPTFIVQSPTSSVRHCFTISGGCHSCHWKGCQSSTGSEETPLTVGDRCWFPAAAAAAAADHRGPRAAEREPQQPARRLAVQTAHLCFRLQEPFSAETPVTLAQRLQCTQEIYRQAVHVLLGFHPSRTIDGHLSTFFLAQHPNHPKAFTAHILTGHADLGYNTGGHALCLP